MKTVKLTNLEIKALLSMSGNMEDEIEDYFSYMPKAELKRFVSAYYSAKAKLQSKQKN